MQIKFEVNGVTQLSRSLRILADDISDLKEFTQEAVDIVKDRSDDIFKQKGKNVKKAPKWAPHSPTTIAMRKARKGHYKKTPSKPSLMRWTGRLQEDVTKKADDKEGSLTYNAPYAKKLAEGDPSKNLPPRAIIDLDRTTNEKLVKALQKKVNKEIGIFNRQY